ncbi:MAG: sigma 54-interacting transcriptional regulator [Desulfitobacteriaceae bacterium]|nr:sigma 54-interacting transcriptional regulator [Desulfitobacteriaceae bacterium]MDD4346369.1 sigma 54-interacting transcriptional regulator [Desulfitobacteriaceae bacterium]MDD4401513.1 sigma 54-interacting transcriptional regulator [Desulfitobacteriaceae bacterium]
MNSKDVFFNKNMILLNPEDTLEQAIRALKETKLNMLPVVNAEGELNGVFTRTNLYNALLSKAFLTSKIEPWIIKVVFSLQEDMSMEKVEEISKNSRVGAAPVVDKNGKVVGVFTQSNVVLNLFKKSSQLNAQLTVIQDMIENGMIAYDDKGCIPLNNKNAEKVLGFNTGKINIIYDGIVVVDKHGHVTLINQVLADFLKVKPDDVLKKHITKLMQNTRLHIIAKTGVPEISEIQNIGEQRYLVSRLPIIKNGVPSGAVGKVVFPQLPEIQELVRRLNTLQSKVQYYEELQNSKIKQSVTNNIIGTSPTVLNLKEEIHKVSRTNSNVLITGESGTGKELVAQAIHYESERSNGPFIKLNCAAIPENLLESEILGYAPGAFSGANRNGKPGRFELADKGTLFLDEIGDMSCKLQAKLLRVIQEREFERVGGTKTITVDVRIITATNMDLHKAVAAGTFREDLYYRINVINLHVPPLRERKSDIELLSLNFIKKLNHILKTEITKLSPEALDIFMNYSWPGNIRELRNVIERAANYALKGEIQPVHLPINLLVPNETLELTQNKKDDTYRNIVKNTQREIIISALNKTGGNKSKAAKMLNMSRTSLYSALLKLNIKY